MLQITILGCGSSVGVPVIGCDCNVCLSSSNYNKRTRSAIYINNETSTILVDFGYDIRFQLLREKIKTLDAAILTHSHSDHVNGIEDLRLFSYIQKKPLDIYTDYETARRLIHRFEHLFKAHQMTTHSIDFFDKVKIGTIEMQFFKQYHGNINSLGFRIGNFVYSSDVSEFPQESAKYLQNITTWIVDCMDYKSNKNHAGLDKVLRWNEIYKPQQILLTNMRHKIDYHKIQEILPSNIAPLYDGYKLTI